MTANLFGCSPRIGPLVRFKFFQRFRSHESPCFRQTWTPAAHVVRAAIINPSASISPFSSEVIQRREVKVGHGDFRRRPGTRPPGLRATRLLEPPKYPMLTL